MAIYLISARLVLARSDAANAARWITLFKTAVMIQGARYVVRGPRHGLCLMTNVLKIKLNRSNLAQDLMQQFA